jgi:hypothetical protein
MNCEECSDMQTFLTKRAGLKLIWRPEANVFEVKSKYIERFRAFGSNISETIEAYGQVCQAPTTWRLIADEIFSGVESYRELVNDALDATQPVELPNYFWFEVLFPLFRLGYSKPDASSLISRVYAFAEWCDWQSGSSIPSRIAVKFQSELTLSSADTSQVFCSAQCDIYHKPMTR